MNPRGNMQFDHPLIAYRSRKADPTGTPGSDECFQLGEARKLLGRLRSAGRGLARQILHELCDFTNSVKRGIHRANEIDSRVRAERRAREDEWIRRGIHPRWPNF